MGCSDDNNASRGGYIKNEVEYDPSPVMDKQAINAFYPFKII